MTTLSRTSARARWEPEIRHHPDHSRLDLRNPLVIDTRELGRRPGTMLRRSRTVPAPDDVGNGVLHVPPGAGIELLLRLESVVEGVLVSGTARGPLEGECVRCLEPVERRFEAEFQELYAYEDALLEDADEDQLRLQGDHLDLQQVVRDAVVLALPLLPLCRAGCAGLCAVCGARLDDDPQHHHEHADSRWAALSRALDPPPADRNEE